MLGVGKCQSLAQVLRLQGSLGEVLGIELRFSPFLASFASCSAKKEQKQEALNLIGPPQTRLCLKVYDGMIDENSFWLEPGSGQ